MFQQEVEKLLHSFSSQASAFIVTSWWEVIAGVPSNPGANQLFMVLLARILCPAVPFNTAPALECFLPNISITVCFPIRRALLRLVPGSTLPACLAKRERERERERERQLRSSAFTNQTDNLSLRCFSRKSKNNCILFPVRLVPSLLHHGGRWSLVCLQIPEPNCILQWFAFCPSCAFQHCTSTWVLFAKYFKHSMLPHPQSVAKTGTS